MGREWYWTGRTSKRGGVGGGSSSGAADRATPSSGCMCAVFQFFDLHQFHFPIQQQRPSFKPSSFIPQDHTLPRGFEAPRNSLESADGTSSSTTKEEENLKFSLGIQIKTRGSKEGKPNDISSDISSSPATKTPTLVARLMGLDLLPDHLNSPSLPSPFSAPNPQAKPQYLHTLPPARYHLQCKPRKSTESTDFAAGYRSLPETPRISSARRSDVDHHRLSLQINKENICLGDELELPRFSYSKKKNEDHFNRNPSHYARQIVKQVTESVSRKVGRDITNNVKNREQRKDDLITQFKSKKLSSKALANVLRETSQSKPSTSPSCSPRFRNTESKIKPGTSSPLGNPKDLVSHPVKPPSSCQFNIQPQPVRVLKKPKLQPRQDQDNSQNQKPVPKCKKATSEKFSSRLKKTPESLNIIRNKQEEPFVRPFSTSRANNIQDVTNKSKRSHPLSNNFLLNFTSVANPLPVKKDPSPSATKLPQKQSQVSDTQVSKHSSQLSSSSSHTYKQEETQKVSIRDDEDKSKTTSSPTTTGAAGAEFQYVTDILSRTGIEKNTPLSFPKWFSPSHPLDPSLFHFLEHLVHTPNPNPTDNFPNNGSKPSIPCSSNELGHRWNRRLLFDAVDEILSDILKPYMDLKPWVVGWKSNRMKGSELVERVCRRVGNFRGVDCRYLEDIDGLVEEDIPKEKIGRGTGVAFEEEGEGLVREIERGILDTLVRDTVLVFCNWNTYEDWVNHYTI